MRTALPSERPLPSPSHQPAANRWLALAVVCICVVVIVLDNTIMNVALPSIQESLNATTSQLQWTVDAYTLVFASLLLTAGTLGDRYGRRGTLTLGLLVFGTGSAIAAFSSSAGMLIALRAVMGIGAAAIYPTTLSIITNVFEGAERGRAIGIWAALSGVGVAAGPILGGILLEHWWWGSVLLVNVPIVILAIIGLQLVVPTSHDRHAPPVDLPGAVLSTASMTALLYGIIEAPRHGWSSVSTVVSIGLGLVLLGVFIMWERRSTHPMLQLRFFRDPRFSVASAALSLTFFALFGYIFLLTQFLQFVRGLSPLAAGLRLAAPALGIMVAAPLAPRIVERVGTKHVVGVGLGIAATAMLALSRTSALTNDALLEPIFVAFGVGMGLTMAPATESIMGSVPRDRAGVGSAVNDTTRQAGGALGVAVLGSLLATRYNARIGALHLPGRLQSLAEQSIGSAIIAAHKLHGPGSSRLVGAAQRGFGSGIELATTVGAVIVFGAALLVARYLPSRSREEAVTVDDARS